MYIKKIIAITAIFLICNNHFSQNSSIETVLQTGHYAEVTSVAFSFDGKYILTGSKDKSIKLWHAENGREIRVYQGHKGSVKCVEFSKDGEKILSVSDDGTAIVWHTKTSKILFHLKIENDNVISACFHPNGNEIIIGSKNSYISSWNIESGEKISTYSAVRKDVKMQKNFDYPQAHTISISNDGKYLVAGSGDYTAIAWDYERNVEINKYKRHKYSCTSCNIQAIISPDNQYIITAYSDSVKLFDLNTGVLKKELFYKKGHFDDIASSSDGQLFAAIQYGKILVWNIKNGKVIQVLNSEKRNSTSINFSPDGKKIVAGNKNRMADIWNIEKGEVEITLKGYLNDIDERILNHSFMYWAALVNETKMSPDGKFVAIGRTGNNVKLLEFPSGKIYKNLKGHNSMAICHDFSDDGKYLASGSLNGNIKVWEVETGKEIRNIQYRDSSIVIFSVDISPNGKYIASAGWAGYIAIWDIETGKMVQSIYAHNGLASYYVKFGPNGLYVLSSGLDKKLKLFEIDTGEEIKEFTGHTNVVSCIDFSKDGSKMLTCSWDGLIKEWDFYADMQIKRINAHEGGVYSVKYDESEEYIISGGEDNLAKIWERSSGKLSAFFEGHKGSVSAVNITNDGEFLITGARDGSIKTWNISNQKELVSHIFIGENDWFVKSANGYFDASQGAFNNIYFVDGIQIYVIDQFFDDFYRPGLFLDMINTRGIENNQLNIIEQINEFPPPTVDIMAPSNNEEFDDPSAMIMVKVMNNGGNVKEFKVLHNGKRIIVQDDDLKRITKKGQSAIKTFSLNLIPGNNEITVSAFSQGNIESEKKSIALNYKGLAKTANCYIIGIGINKYENPALNLTYAKADAKSIVEILSSKTEKLFNKIQIVEIYDTKATKEMIFNTIDELANIINEEDVFCFYYAGHGSTVNSKFYFIPTNSTSLYQEDKLDVAISAEELQEKFKRIKALKQLVVMDACHSGTSTNILAMRGAGEEKALAQLARSSGVHVLASAGSEQTAAEVAGFGHGVFTYVLIEALNGKADGAPRDSKVTVYELKSYLDDQVPEVSFRSIGHKQYPTTFSIGHDFPVVME
ncbi:caspase family protein [Bacteroidota bacterium]